MAKQEGDVRSIFKKLTLAPETREEEKKGEYPGGRWKQITDTMKAEQNGLMRVSLWLILYLLPLIAVIVYAIPVMVDKVAGSYNFMGNVGIGYPGTSDSIIVAKTAIYDTYAKLMLLIIPCGLFLAVGLSGAFNCAKKYLWGEKVLPTKDFYRGVKKYYFKFLVLTLLSMALIAGVGEVTVWLQKCRLTGNNEVIAWILTVLSYIVALLLLTVNVFAMPSAVTYKISLTDTVKNAAILDSRLLLISVGIVLMCCAPVAILLLGGGNILTFLVYVLMVMFGFSFIILSMSALAQFSFDNVINPLYSETQVEITREVRKEHRKSKKGGKK